MISVLTPTGARLEAFTACVGMMQAQTYSGPVRWVVVDDGPEAMPTPHVEGWEIVHVRPDPLWQPGQNTQARNILCGLGFVTDQVVIVEDDDAYEPWWIERCAERLRHDEMVGESHSLYINRETGKRAEMGNANHASLCSTALRGAAIEWLRDICRHHEKGIDLHLWKLRGRLYKPHPRGVTGIKGWPGRPGIGVGHRL